MLDSKAVALEFLRHLADGDVDTAISMLDPAAVLCGPDGARFGPDTLRSNFQSFSRILAGPYRMVVIGAIAEDGRVAVETTGDALLTNGRRYLNRYHFLFEIADGRVCTMREYCDTRAIEEAFAAEQVAS